MIKISLRSKNISFSFLIIIFHFLKLIEALIFLAQNFWNIRLLSKFCSWNFFEQNDFHISLIQSFNKSQKGTLTELQKGFEKKNYLKRQNFVVKYIVYILLFVEITLLNSKLKRTLSQIFASLLQGRKIEKAKWH